MDRITDAFAWPVRDPRWAQKVAVVGLILLVPIAGQINGLGWMLSALDRLRRGDETLPPAGFGYLGRGLPLFAVNVVYALALSGLVGSLFVPAYLVSSSEGGGPGSAGLFALALLLDVLVFSLGTLGLLALYLALPAIILGTEERGLAGGLNLVAVYRRIRRSPVDALIAGLMLIAVGFVGQIGLVACVAGVLFTSAYALAMQAWVVRSYEVGTGA